jgi:putative peptidoglycan lipid II flippase
MTRASQDGNRVELREALSHGLRTMAVATVFGALALFALAGPLGMFFSGGERTDGVMLAQTLTILALSTPFMSANFMMSRVFYANEDARTPFYIQLILALVNMVGAFAIQFLPVGQIIYAIAILYMFGNILSVVISAFFLRRLLGHLDGARVANSYIRMGYAALGSALAGALALWLLGSYQASGFAWSSRPAALVTIVVVGPVMMVAYFLLLRLFHVSELQALLRPLLGRLGKGPTPERATVSDDTGLIPRISGEFDAASYRAGPVASHHDEDEEHFPSEYGDGHTSSADAHPGVGSDAGAGASDGGPDGGKPYLPQEDVPSTAQGSLVRQEVPLPGRRTYQGAAGRNPHFRRRSRRKG